MIYSNEMIKSVSDSNYQILKDIQTLYLNGNDYECDLTFSLGKMYKKSKTEFLNPPKLKYDKFPMSDDIHQLDDFLTEVEDNSLESIVCDPPFIVRPSNKGKASMIKERFESYSSVKDFEDSQDKLLMGGGKKLKINGILVYKIQNSKMFNQKQLLAQNYVINKATELGFELIDEFIKINKTPLPIKGDIQHCSRKVHSYFLVFRKKKV